MAGRSLQSGNRAGSDTRQTNNSGRKGGDIKWSLADDPDALLGDVMSDFEREAAEEASRRAAQQKAREEEAERRRQEEEARRQEEIRRRIQEEEERRRRHEMERLEHSQRLISESQAQMQAVGGPDPAESLGDTHQDEGLSPEAAAASQPVVPAAAPAPVVVTPKGPTKAELALRAQVESLKRFTIIGIAVAVLFLLVAGVMAFLWLNTGGERDRLQAKLDVLSGEQKILSEKLGATERKLARISKSKDELEAQLKKKQDLLEDTEEALKAAEKTAGAAPKKRHRVRRTGRKGGKKGGKKPGDLDLKLGGDGGLVF